MPQRRPRRRPDPTGAPAPAVPPQQTTVGGWHYTVDGRGLETFRREFDRSESAGAAAVRDMSTDVPADEARSDIGRAGMQQAAKDAGRPRSASTVHRWARKNRIPDERTAELVQRRAFVARRGGPDRLAEELGVPVSRVRRWQSGRTDTMRGAAAGALAKARLADARERAGMAKIHGARLRVTAQVEYRALGSVSYEHRGSRTIDIDLGESEAQQLNDALIAGDHARGMAMVESAWSHWYRHSYSDEAGVHMLGIEDFGIDWH
ncbi:hypothetical protein [Nocardia wallacei]|uniref:hypothetical protein n=1 Tax=Nocardia wallacei TaxID=480035 RepID=UPI002456C178|nr:hypothetical protein [Nocardia wallacei]